jgi:indolepyruvate ferredoxin oxidoreductase alpha subunit
VAALKEAIAFEGVSVVIARQDCVLQARSLKKKTGRPFRVDPQKCANHRNCINELACPAFYMDDDRVCIDASICTGCSVCAQVCPENAIVPVKEKK